MSPDPRIAESLWRPYLEPVRVACRMQTPEEDPVLVLAHWARETWFGTCGSSYVVPIGLPIWMGRGDGGHGHGFPQIDDRGEFAYLIPPAGEDWPIYQQALDTCTVLAGARVDLADFRGARQPRAWGEAVACRYNARLEAVRWCLRNDRDPNGVTSASRRGAPGDYGRDVLQLRDQLREFFPGDFT